MLRKFLTSTAGILIGGALLAFLGVWLYGVYTNWRAGNATDWKAKYAQSQDSVEFYKGASTKATFVYDTIEKPKYIRVRDAAVNDPTTPESTRRAYEACDLVLSACDSAQLALRGQVRALETQNDLLRNKPGPARVVGYGDALYDVVGLRPVFRAGGNVKVLGPLHVRLEGEYAIPSRLREAEGGFRVLVGGRINFNK